MKFSMLDTAFVGAAAGGGGGGNYGVSFDPDGGAYTPGMSFDLDWTGFPTGAAMILATRHYSLDGGVTWTRIVIQYMGLIAYPTGPYTLLMADLGLPPGTIQRLGANFADAGYHDMLGSDILSANFV